MGELKAKSSGALLINKSEAPSGRHLVTSSATALGTGDEARIFASHSSEGRAVYAQFTFRSGFGILALYEKGLAKDIPLCDEQRLTGVGPGIWVDLAICCDSGKIAAVAGKNAGPMVRCRGESSANGTGWGLGTGRVFREVKFSPIHCIRHYPVSREEGGSAGCPHCGQTCPCCDDEAITVVQSPCPKDVGIRNRIERIYAALGRVVERDLNAIPPSITKTASVVSIHQDFSGGANSAELEDALNASVGSIASFHDHLQEWGGNHNVSEDAIHNYFKSSPEYCIVRDLWNRDKHGGDPHKDGWSKKAPRIQSVKRVLRMSAGGQILMDRSGEAIVSGDGDVKTVLTGVVVDKQGNKLGNAFDYVERAIQLCEAAIKHFGVS